MGAISNIRRRPAEALTLASIKEAIQLFQMEQMDRELDILLSDNGPALLQLLHGGELIEIGGQYYVISREAFMLSFKPSWPLAQL